MIALVLFIEVGARVRRFFTIIYYYIHTVQRVARR